MCVPFSAFVVFLLKPGDKKPGPLICQTNILIGHLAIGIYTDTHIHNNKLLTTDSFTVECEEREEGKGRRDITVSVYGKGNA